MIKVGCVYFLSFTWKSNNKSASHPRVMANLTISTSQANPPQLYLPAPGSCCCSKGSGGYITKSQRKTVIELGRDERSCSSLFSFFLPVAASAESRKNKVKQRRKKGERDATFPLNLAAQAKPDACLILLAAEMTTNRVRSRLSLAVKQDAYS